MEMNHRFVSRSAALLLSVISLTNYGSTQSKSNQYACTEVNPAQQCNASNTCGSASEPCVVDVKRTSSAASATAAIQKPKGNALFCVKTGTTVQWMSSAKEIGFVVDLGPTSPFEPPGAIIGGSDRTVSVVAKKAGCYKYSAGACRSGAIYGMCGTGYAKVIVIEGK